MSQNKQELPFEETQTHSDESENLEIADTFQDAGTRPIAQSPDYLVPERMQENQESDTSKSETSST